jgi:hypothetical protein
MTAFPVPRVDIGSLSLGAQLGIGGQGRVVAVDGFRINGEWPAVLKVYAPAVVNEMDAGVLEKIVGLPRQLPGDDSRWLLENTAWPAVIVEDQGVVCGFLMRLVPSGFFFGFQTRTQGVRQKLADTAFLLNPDSYVSSSGLAVSDRDRLGLLGNVAAALARLHALGIAAGDFSPKNVLFSLKPAPSCFLIDCDGVRLHGESVFEQIETPDWEVPPAEAKATTATDAYKFGLLAIRLFARDQSARDPAALTAMSAELGRLAGLSQDLDPSQRPEPAAWASALSIAECSASTAPTAPQPVPSQSRRISVPVPTVSATPAASPVSPAASPVSSAPPSIWRRPGILATAAIAAVLLIAIIGVGVHALSHPTPGPPVVNIGQNGNGISSSAQQSTPPAQPTAPAGPVKVGRVTIPLALATDPRAKAVAEMFNTYFSAINQHDYQTAVSVFDPGGEFNPNDPQYVQALANGLATTTDSKIVVASIRPPAPEPARKAEITFRSHQAAGYGPSGDTSETCTNWDLIYTISQPSGQYLIDKVKGTNSPC